MCKYEKSEEGWVVDTHPHTHTDTHRHLAVIHVLACIHSFIHPHHLSHAVSLGAIAVVSIDLGSEWMKIGLVKVGRRESVCVRVRV